jgi:hypothetical protein
MASVSFTMPFSLLSAFLYFHLLLALSRPVHAQNVISTSVSFSAATASGFAVAMSSQAAWWEKKWDVVVVGSGPGGIIGKFPRPLCLTPALAIG